MTRKELELTMENIERMKHELSVLEDRVASAEVDPWEPERGEDYHYINTTGRANGSAVCNDDYCQHNLEIGNAHETAQHALDWDERRKTSTKLFRLARKSWGGKDVILGYYLVAREGHRIDVVNASSYADSLNPHFKTREDAKEAIDAIGIQPLVNLFEKGL